MKSHIFVLLGDFVPHMFYTMSCLRPPLMGLKTTQSSAYIIGFTTINHAPSFTGLQLLQKLISMKIKISGGGDKIPHS